MGGRRWPDIWIPRPRFAYSLCNLYLATMTFKSRLLANISIVKAFLAGFWSRKMAESCDLWIGGRRWPHIWIPWPRLAYSLYNFHSATITTKGSLQGSIPIVKTFFRWFIVQNLVGSRDLCTGGRRWPHIWIPWPRLAYSLYNFHWATMTIKGSLQASIPIVKAFLTRNFKSRRKLAKNLRFWGENRVEM